MKKIIKFSFVLIFFTNCSNLYIKTEEIDHKKIKNEIALIENELINEFKKNNIKKIEDIFLPTFKNKIILNELKSNDLSYINIMFAENIDIKSNLEARKMMLLNYGYDTYYFQLQWKYENKKWKIADVWEEK